MASSSSSSSSSSMSTLKLKAVSEPNPNETAKKSETIDLGNGSDVVFIQRLIPSEQSWKWFNYLDKHIPWTRPTIRVFGKSFLQPRDTCYVATSGLTELSYSGYQPHAYSWDDYPPLKDILDAVGITFNQHWYKGGDDYVGWHADDEKLYGPTPEIASLSLGCDRDFVLKKKPSKKPHGMVPSVTRDGSDEPASKRLKKSSNSDQHTFRLKHGSLLVMRGYTQRDWIHSVPKRAKAEATRINLTFRRVF
ncbi:DNA oxidative demethylase ALKBH2 isoform X3 [Medicago truncatula]|uniref:DNA oxidative demethylase ALKBH2 isoform X3 n=1 Tax=Medicago truncatula TaxID=3880 RepID=UPI000D2F1CD3|nr:DNA oxidative demethylase ALKBH2 isoform X3 [Medicago truncatula]